MVKMQRGGKTVQRWELVEFQGERPMLALNGDEGSKFFAAVWFIAGCIRARVGWMRDGGHKRWRDFQLAVDRMGWRPHLQEALLVMNLPFGPWLSEIWLTQIKEALATYAEESGAGGVLLQLFYEHIAMDLGMHRNVAVGTRGHRQLVLRMVIGARCFSSRGFKVAMRSFFIWVESAWEELLPFWHTLMFVLVFIGIRLGHYFKGWVISVPVGSFVVVTEFAQPIAGDTGDIDQSISMIRK